MKIDLYCHDNYSHDTYRVPEELIKQAIVKNTIWTYPYRLISKRNFKLSGNSYKN